MNKVYFILLSFLMIPVHANAVEAEGTVTRLYVRQGGVVLFNLSVGVPQKPECATSGGWQYFFELQASGGAGMLDMLNRAKQAGSKVRVGHSSTCQFTVRPPQPHTSINYVYEFE